MEVPGSKTCGFYVQFSLPSILAPSLKPWFSATRVNFSPPRRHWVISEDNTIFLIVTTEKMLLASRGQKPGRLLNSPPMHRAAPTARTQLAAGTNSAKIEKACLKSLTPQRK